MQIYSIRKISGEPIKSNKVSQVKIKDQIVNIATTNNSKEYEDLIKDLEKECYKIKVIINEILLHDEVEILENFINFSMECDEKELDYSPFTVSYNIFTNGQISKQRRHINGNITTKILGNIFKDENDSLLWQTARKIYNKYWGDK